MGISEQELEELQKRPGVKAVRDSREGCQTSSGSSPGKRGPRHTSAHRPPPKEQKDPRNQTEIRYERECLYPRFHNGEIVDWVFERIKFRMADKTFYTPDYLVIAQDCIEIHEVKGSREEEDARVKWKTVAEQNPWFRFIVARWFGKKKGWKIEKY